MHELLRVPLLISHFLQHKKEKPGLEMVEFLVLHYSEDHPDDQDEKEDSGLPFKEGQLNHVDPGFLPVYTETVMVYEFPLHIVPGTIGYPLQKSFTIFRPPQFV